MKNVAPSKLLFVLLLILVLFVSACGSDDEKVPENKAPTITNQSFSAAEDIDDNIIIGVVQASDPDEDEISFSITETVEINGDRDFSGLFEIDETTGELSLADGKYLDFEDASGFSVTVSVSDAELTTTASITISVTDVEEGNIPFVTSWSIIEPNQTISFSAKSGLEYNYNVDWGDGISENGLTGSASHTYTNKGYYRISISGVFPAIKINSPLDIRFIEQWGNIEWATMEGAFEGCIHLRESATDAPNLSRVTDMQSMFSKCERFHGDLNNWDVSNVRNMSYLFQNTSPYNEEDLEIKDWDVSNVTNMEGMFDGANAFIHNIGSWDVGNVINMKNMFRSASSFNQDIGSWDVSNVADMSSMFADAHAFNQDIGGWDVGNVINMNSMFRSASSFNQDIGNWDIRSVTDMSSMFADAPAFNQDLSQWDVGSVKYCYAFSNNSGLTDANRPNFTKCDSN